MPAMKLARRVFTLPAVDAAAREATLLDCLSKVQHMAERVKRPEQSILEVAKLAPAPVQAVIQGLHVF